MLITHGIPENMEERPWTKSEFFAWNDGRRIVDLYELSKQLQCKRCSSLLDLRRTEREARYGLASVLYILCNCGVINDVHTAKTQQDGGNRNSPNLYEVNIKASINLLMYGAGASRILSFLALLDIPVPPPDDTSLIVPFTEDAEMRNVSPPLPTSPTTTTSVTSKPSESNVTVSDNLLSFQKTQPSSTSSSSCVPNSEFSPVPHPLPPDGDSSEFAVPLEETDNEEELNEDEDDDDDEYVPPSKKPKSKFKPKFTPASRKLSLLRGPKNARTQKAAKQAAQKQSTKIKIKVKRIKEEKETPKNIEEIKEENEEEENSKHYANPVEWSSSESDTESTGVKAKDSDTSWQEDEEEEEDQKEDDYIRPKRKRGRPRGSTDKAKRARKFEPPTKRVEEEEEEKDLPKCTTCAKDFSSIKGYNVHMKRVHNQEIKVSPVAGREQRSGQQNPAWQTIKEEQVTDSLYMCPVCNALFSQAKCLTVHLKKAHQIECSEVDPYGISMEGSVLRLKRVWKDQDRHRTSYKCLKCDTIIHHHRKFAQHIRVTSDKQITCETICPDGRSLGGYQRTLFLKGYKNYLCHTCGASFTEKSTFFNHIEGHGETVVKKFMCEFCPYSSTRQRRMTNHTLSKHSTEPRPRPNVCELCGKGFFNKNMLRRHKIDVHIKEKKFKCDICPKVFLRRHKLQTHMNCHSGIRPFICSHCGQTFTAAYNLKVHQRLHTGEKPYKCEQCEAAFAQKNSLDVHMRKHGLGSTRQERSCSNSQPRADIYQSPRTGSPTHLEVSSPPHPKMVSSQHERNSIQQYRLPSAQQHKIEFHSHTRTESQQHGDFHHNQRVDSNSQQQLRVDSYVYPGYSGVVFPELPSSTYPFYQNN